VTRRRYARIAVLGAALTACCLLLAFWMVSPRDAAAHTGSSVLLTPRATRVAARAPQARAGSDLVAAGSSLAACEARIEGERGTVPTVAIVGASYTAGVGPNNPELSWAVRLARLLHWNAVIDGVSGAGYVQPGDGGRGPVAHLLGQENLRGLRPSLVIVQAGHDDVGTSPAVERARVGSTIGLIRDTAPGARIALLTTFADTPEGTPALRQTDHAIVAAGTAAGPGLIIMDPLAGGWTFARAGDGLHPTAAGDAWIAHQVEAIALAHGLRPAAATSATPVICDASVGAGKPRAATT
jgi:lysophospholipase L1-like esterase